MLLCELVATSEEVAATAARGAKIRLLAGCLRRLAADEVAIGVSYLSGQLRQRQIGVGSAAVRGAAAAAERPSLTLTAVDSTLERIGRLSGKSSQAERRLQLTALLEQATVAEQDFLRRLLVGDVRQGAQEGVMLEAIAQAAGIAPGDVRRALLLSGSLTAVAAAALRDGAAGLRAWRIDVGRPVQPMLAQSAAGLPDALTRIAPAAIEWKLDGMRVQLHRRGDAVQVFTRSLDDITLRVPELVEVALALPVRDVVLDGEALVLRPNGRPQPFQVTAGRFGNKLAVDQLRATLPLTPFLFDVLHLDGDDLIDRPAVERHAVLASVIPDQWRVPRLVTADPTVAEAFLAQALERGHEGVLVKSLDAPYEAGRRGAGWIKVKPRHTLDLVVLAAEWGNGRRQGWLSNLHLGARDPGSGEFVMLGKTFKGLTDALLGWQTQRLLELEVRRDQWTVYVRPELVVEIAFDGIQRSPRYPGGVTLRFARVLRYRSDKRAADADTIEMVRTIGGLEPA